MDDRLNLNIDFNHQTVRMDCDMEDPLTGLGQPLRPSRAWLAAQVLGPIVRGLLQLKRDELEAMAAETVKKGGDRAD